MDYTEVRAKLERAVIDIALQIATTDDPAQVEALLAKQSALDAQIARITDIMDKDEQTASAEAAEDREADANKIMEDFIQKTDIYYLTAQNKYLVKLEDGYHALSDASVVHHFPKPLRHNNVERERLSRLVYAAGRNRIDRCYTIRTPEAGYVNMFDSNLCPTVAADRPHFAFDVLMHSLGGGSAENIQAIEQWIICRYNQIDWRIEDVTFPALVFNNKGGGSGKGLLTERVFPVIFGKAGVLPNASMQEVTSKFNSILLQKVVVHINETAMEKTDTNKLKMLLGSPTLQVEAKYMQPFTIPNVMAFIISGNDSYKVVALKGNKVDRRFSVVRSDLVFDEVLLEVAQELTGKEYSSESLKVFLSELVEDVYSNPLEVGKWLHCLREKYPNLRFVEGHHGKDYHEAVGLQQSLEDRLITRILDDSATEAICSEMVWLAYCHNHKLEGANYAKQKKAGLLKAFEEAALSRGFKTKRAYDDNRNTFTIYYRPTFDVGEKHGDNGNYNPNLWRIRVGESQYESKVLV